MLRMGRNMRSIFVMADRNAKGTWLKMNAILIWAHAEKVGCVLREWENFQSDKRFTKTGRRQISYYFVDVECEGNIGGSSDRFSMNSRRCASSISNKCSAETGALERIRQKPPCFICFSCLEFASALVAGASFLDESAGCSSG